MSFILDALKKSETDRQQRGSAEFASVPVGAPNAGPPRWLWVLGALLVINIVVVAGLLLRPETQPAAPPPVAQTAAPEAREPVTEATQVQFAAEIAAAKLNAPPREESAATTPIETTPAPAPRQAPSPVAAAPVNALALPTVQEVVADGSLTLPALHVDVHVYSDSPADRFVFINMAKHKEGSVLAEGPRVESITPNGVVLSQNGVTFLLPRD
ncbi:MAG: general secretion pathway protein GspB [Woeseiaceae bacterium]|nr:general secretion pathway protein GspB [Woeseiaceae bacterium]